MADHLTLIYLISLTSEIFKQLESHFAPQSVKILNTIKHSPYLDRLLHFLGVKFSSKSYSVPIDSYTCSEECHSGLSMRITF